jgi:two-component system, chemotaxis family, CheB/CheR fusion protein
LVVADTRLECDEAEGSSHCWQCTAHAEAEATDRRMREILERIDHAFYALDEGLRLIFVNRRAMELFGKPEGELIGRAFDEVLADARFVELAGAHRRTLESGAPVEAEIARPGGDGWLAVSVHPSESGLSVLLRDVSERKRTAERQRLLTAELQHRVKNILAVVRSVASRTLESSEGLDDFAAHFDGRLRALARTQGVLARQAGGDIDLDEIVREELLSHAAREGEQVSIGGPPVRLKQGAAEIFSLAVHELATNAVKYGALSRPSGRISVVWRLADSGDGRRLSFEWRESGVAAMDPQPCRKGFGRDLLERGLPYDLPGTATSLTFAPGGLQCVIDLPVNECAFQSFSFEDREGTKK